MGMETITETMTTQQSSSSSSHGGHMIGGSSSSSGMIGGGSGLGGSSSSKCLMFLWCLLYHDKHNTVTLKEISSVIFVIHVHACPQKYSHSFIDSEPRENSILLSILVTDM